MKEQLFNKTSAHIISGYNYTDELKKFGIEYLTSEACGYSMRALFDINQIGQDYLSAFFGGIEFLANGWNSSSKKSVMLPKGQFIIDLLIFCYLESEFACALYVDAGNAKVVGLQPMIRFYNSPEDCTTEARHFSDSWQTNYRIYEGKNRNTHAFSGRTY